MKNFLLVLSLLVAALGVSACTSVDYLKDVGKSFEKLQHMNDELNVSRSRSDETGFVRKLEDMKRLSDQIGSKEPGDLTKKVSKDVKEKNDKISALIDELLKESKAASPDDRKIDDNLKKLTDELWDAVK